MFEQNYIHSFQNPVQWGAERGTTFALNIKAMMTHEYQLNGMTCNNCVTTVEKLLLNVPGVTKARVSLPDQKATIEMSSHVDIKELKKALQSNPKFSIDQVPHLANPSVTAPDEEVTSFWTTYKPILLIFSYLVGLTVLVEITSPQVSIMRWMGHFMAGFFIVFSFFKLLDLPAFASSYSTYDIIAKRWYGWGYIYPFVELLLGVLFLTNYQLLLTNIITVVVMGISSIGVIQSLLLKRKIR